MTSDRELLMEIGCEELPASWLPGIAEQLAEVVGGRLREHRLTAATPVETFATPRRLTARVAGVPERQEDLEDLVTGPPVAAGFKLDGTPTPAATGFASKQGVAVGDLERVRTAKGEYLAIRKHVRGRAAVDVLPGILGETLRGLAFPKSMRWDALLEDGRGDLVFGRPIRWLLFLYGGRVVPFTISRTSGATSTQVQDVATGAVTYGHRFLTTSGRPGRAIKVRSFDEYRTKLLENFVVLEREDRRDKIVSQLDAKAQRLQGRVSRMVHADSTLLQEVPDLVEYPAVVSGTFAVEFLELPDEVLGTALIHHQHYFPVEDATGALKNAFLAVINIEPENERAIARNTERVVTARLRDARFFWEADRRMTLESRLERLATLTFHKKLGTYREKADRIARLAEWIAGTVFGAGAEAAAQARLAGRLAKADLATDMVREFTELQGVMGGVYARAEGLPEAVAKAIYYQYLPIGVEADAAPSRADLGNGGAVWAAVALADKLDTIVGLFAVAGERPTGSRDPFGLRRAAQGVVKILADLPGLCGIDQRITLGALVDKALEPYGAALDRAASVKPQSDWSPRLAAFLAERLRYVLQQRGAAYDEVNAVVPAEATVRDLDRLAPSTALARAAAVAQARQSQEFVELAELFKRVKNISKDVAADRAGWADLTEFANTTSSDDAERALIRHAATHAIVIHEAEAEGRYLDALKEIAALRPFVARYFEDVLVMAENMAVREKRLQLMAGLRDMVLEIADISEVAPTREPSQLNPGSSRTQ
jgi:glycyl-tRNA synthetase beta chain